MKLILPPLLVLFYLSAFSTIGHSTEIPAGSIHGEALLGSAYQSDKQLFPGDRCLTAATIVGAGRASAGFTFQTSMTESQLSSELGMGLGGRARSGAVEYSASANFLKNSVSNELSVSSAWESSYTFPVDKLVATRNDLNETGKAMLNNPERWAETCGDEYVNELTRGAQLFFSIRVDFHSTEDKQQFEARFSVSGPLAEVQGELKEASRKFSRSTTVTVSAYQVGGDISKITEIFGDDANARQGFVQCQLGNFDRCADVIQKGINYAADVHTGFPSQIAPGTQPGSAVITYRTAKYSAIGIYLQNYPGVSEATKIARQEVSNAFENNFRYDVAANRLLQTRNIGDRRQAISVEKDKVERNITTILDVSETCYNQPLICWAYKQDHLKLEAIDESVFLPPTFTALCLQENAFPELHTTLEKIRAAVASPAGETCPALEARVKRVSELNLSGHDSPQDALDLRPLATLTQLERLTLSGSKIVDINPLSDLVNLKVLDLAVNHITSVEPLSDMMDLVHLNLNSNIIEQVGQLSGLLRLQYLYLANNKINDLSQLTYLPQIINVDIRLNPVALDQINKFRNAMPPTAIVQYQ